MEDRCTEKKLPVSVCLAGPGGEDLEGGYYDAGDNLKVDTDTLCVMRLFELFVQCDF